jgi:hypothetical protein
MTRMIQVRIVEMDDRGERTELRCWNVGYDPNRHGWVAGGADGNGPTHTTLTQAAAMSWVAEKAYRVYAGGALAATEEPER